MNKNHGFTLIETFVAVTILMIAVMGPLGMLARSLIDVNYIKNQIIATQLAQEGIELVVAKRNYNYDTGGGGHSFDGFENCASGCRINYNSSISTSNFFATCGNPGPHLGFQENPAGIAIYNYSSGNTPFWRIITITLESITDPTGGGVDARVVKVTSEVSWSSGLLSSTAKMETYLYDRI